MSVEGGGAVVDGIYEHEPSGGSFPGGNRLAEGFGKQERAVTLGLVDAFDGETASRTMPIG